MSNPFRGLQLPGIADDLIGTATPPGAPFTTGTGRAVLASDDFDGKPIRFRFAHGGCRVSPPEPIVQETDLMGAISLTQWVGQKPYKMEIDAQLDGYPYRSVEDDIKTLEHFAEVHAGRREPPIVTVDGNVPKPHPNLTWRVTGFSTPAEEYVVGDGTARARWFSTVTLVQRVTDRVLVESLKATSQSRGVRARTITVRTGEEWLFEVARRAYKDPSRAGDIATANNLHLGKRLTAGMELRLP
jgi:hypothetical protein